MTKYDFKLAAKRVTKNQPPPRRHVVLAFYILFGALHELAHVLTAFLTNQTGGLLNDGIGLFLFRTLLLRQCNLPEIREDFYGDLVRHSGWVASLLFLYFSRNSKNAQLAASLTALEAISTDLLGFIPKFPNGVLFCGNFGVIMLHKAWSSNGDTTVLDILEKMVQVTMMRGAQSGGVVAFHCQENHAIKGVRSRVVNSKRTDLSKKIRKKLQQDVSLEKGDIPFFSGHTRFATSSKATFSGTHPQQWTPPTMRRVYDFNVPHSGRHLIEPRQIRVENYVTHNGDFDFYNINGITYDLEIIQNFLANVLGPMPAEVDSCALAGVIDLLRTQGCFGLSARYVVCFGLSTSRMQLSEIFPAYTVFEKIGLVFEEVLREMLKSADFDQICERSEIRQSFAVRVFSKFENQCNTLMKPLEKYLIDDSESGTSLHSFCLQTINAFFDNDLFFATKTFLKNAKGSFGLCVTSSLDANRQIALAARGQTISIAFYPRKGLICYGSEQAAVKAGMNFEFPSDVDAVGKSRGDIDNDTLRLDLDDLNGEVIILDWGKAKYKNSPVSKPNRHIVQHELMNGSLHAILFQESKATSSSPNIYNRMTHLTRNRFINPLRPECPDPILRDIHDIPKICYSIQNEWKVDKAAKSLNRLTAFNLSRCLRERLEAHIKGAIHPKAIDILLTGCEVSLWLAEQFASDMQKSFPNLRIEAVSSNKLLGLYGQEIAVPSFGFPDAPETHHLHDTIVIIVSHSGGTFAPLSCSNLLQSKTRNLFVITSEWDTQIGKQLRAMDTLDNSDEVHISSSRIFTTEVGIRSAEPCSVSVVATHQLLTNLFEYICVIILSDYRYRQLTNATISEQDLKILETCNQKNIDALCDIIGATVIGEPYCGQTSETTMELREAGNLWAEHVLENAKAYIMTFVYIFATVISGNPLVYGIAQLLGFTFSKWIYLIRLLDAAIYFWMPQINILILRLIQGRNLRHRMVGRTVVIADIPWVAQAADAFLSKIFACSYSIAGLNVLSGNPADHFVHRHTHRVVRGSLVICGRPDGRLSALSTAEASVCLSINQASSIQSLGGTCESITIGHNPFKLPLTKNAIFLKRKRPLFLCERILVESDVKEESGIIPTLTNQKRFFSLPQILQECCRRREIDMSRIDSSSHHNCSIRPLVKKKRSAVALIGAYMNFDDPRNNKSSSIADEEDEVLSVEKVVQEAIEEKKWSDNARKLFTAFDADGDGLISLVEFLASFHLLSSSFSEEEIQNFFQSADLESCGYLDYDEFQQTLKTNLRCGIKLPPSNRNERGLIQMEASQEKYFGQILRKYSAGKSKKDVDFLLARNQHFSQELYETRIASLQRFVAMTVMFHQMGKRVQEFFQKISFGCLGYRMDRTHSIMRIATTASPVSGADVRQRMRHLQLLKKVQHSIHVISTAYIRYKNRK